MGLIIPSVTVLGPADTRQSLVASPLIDWRLVTNLVFLLLLLLTARSALARSAPRDDQLATPRIQAKRFYGLVSGAAGLRFAGLWESAHAERSAR
jgi:hypothetical protein